ncbi:hypothetical protein MSAN_00671800 [Mycena sanguinolenta]|uniref:BTB domain-containing protein n=1 Tax=Mycena sanguinolenta TaxID=230812 RepID=A0A8H6Z470_9AGAR|nr:hypothetical protein MSAN_00671800 [Mycena sanguinolenta]
MSSPPAKRKRQKTEDATMKRSDKFWFTDGSVVLQAGSTQFRVHFGVLARHSAIFSDMLGLPQPSDEPNVDGCPVIQLSDDSTDLEYFLKALYDPAFLTIKAMPFPAVAALIRLGRKYEFRDFLNLAVARITSEFPTTLEEFDALPPYFTTITDYPGLGFDIVALADENNIASVLPGVYLYVVDGLLDELFGSIKKDDGTMAALSPIHLRRCAVGREKLLLKQLQPGYTLGWTLDAVTVDGCTGRSKCRKARQMFMRQCLDGSRIWAFMRIDCLKNCELCTVCHDHAMEAANGGRIKMWEELPQIFNLPPWDELTNDI